MFAKRPLPVYLFTGFLDSGKTSFIRQTMDEGQFKDGLTTLMVVCEEGEESIDIMRLDDNKFVVRKIEDEDSVTEEAFLAFQKEVKPDRIIIEANGMWDINELLDALPGNWELAEVITPIDSTTFEMYLSNMKMMMTNQYLYSDLVVFNRCKDEYDRAMFKRMVRAVNRRAQVLYETPEGKVEDNVPEELPYDINADVIEVGDEDYGIFYIDTFENIDNYLNKTVRFKAKAAHPKDVKKDNVFVVARPAMTCCAEDIALVGFPCEYDKQAGIKEGAWVDVTAKVQAIMNRQTNEPSPYMIATNIETTSAPEDEVAYFY